MKDARFMRGIEARRTTTGEAVVYIKFRAHGKDRRERIGTVPKEHAARVETLARHEVVQEARRRLRACREEIKQAHERGERWLSAPERAELAKDAAAALQDARQDLLFEVASERFLRACSSRYADERGLRGFHRRLAKAFKGRYLDEVTKADVQRYIEDRVRNAGAFEGWGRTVGLRPAQLEIAALSALYRYLQDEEERDLSNPCARAWARRRHRTKGETYRPKRASVLPTDVELAAIFETARAWRGDVVTGADLHAACVLGYYLAARPESEQCRLRHRDVTLPQEDVTPLRPEDVVLGRIVFRSTKTGGDRELVLHPEAAKVLREIMLQEPEDPTEWEAWAETPIFRRRDGKPWTRHTYRRAWSKTLAAVSKDHPRLRGMIFRDLRPAANTRMREQGTDAAIAAKILGHSAEVNARHYVRATDPAARKAILSLTVQGSDIGVGHAATAGQSATSSEKASA